MTKILITAKDHEMETAKKLAEALSRKSPTSGSAFYRPKTRGEMRDKLKEGVPCEIVISNALVSLSLLRSLDCLKDDGFTIDSCSVRESENKGYAVFEPNAGSEPR